MDTSNENPPLSENEIPAVADQVPDSVLDGVTEQANVDDLQDSADAYSGWHSLLEMFKRPGIGIALVWIVVLIAEQVVVTIGAVVLAVIGIVLSGQPMNGPNISKTMEASLESWMLPVISFSTMAFAFVAVVLLFGRQTARCMGFRGMTVTQTATILLLALPMAVLTSEFANLVSHLFPKLEMPEIFANFAKQPALLVFCAGCLFPGVGEELFFRGFLSRGLVSRHGVVWGTFFTAFLFGAVHLHPIQASGAFFLGLTLQMVFLTTQSLWGAILLHTANNALAFAAMLYGELMPIPGFTMASETEIMHSPPLLVLVAALTVGMMSFVLHQTRTQWLLPDGKVWSRGFVTSEGPPLDTEAKCVAPWIGLRELVGACVMYAAFLLTLVYYIES